MKTRMRNHQLYKACKVTFSSLHSAYSISGESSVVESLSKRKSDSDQSRSYYSQDTSTRLFLYKIAFLLSCSLKTLGCTNLDDLAQFDSQLQLSLAAWGYYYEDYIKLSTGVRVLQASKESRDQDYEIQLVRSLAERRLNEKWSFGKCHTNILLCYVI